ncbi:hypothetical protein JB92DRAFT_1899463 [Gautieria morchelliformis]|nr:hypothetical protein JB92DRAFT_1899463 [Gautieria morchelliformis]
MAHERYTHSYGTRSQGTSEVPEGRTAAAVGGDHVNPYGYRDPILAATTSASVGHITPQIANKSKPSTYLAITGPRPYASGKTQAKATQDSLRTELEGSYDGPNAKLLDEFFPFPDKNDGLARHADTLSEFYVKSKRPPAKDANGARGENLKMGWKDIPEPPVTVYQRSILEEDIIEGLVPILNAIISHEGLSDCRVAIDRQQNAIPTFGGGPLKPDIFLWGKGTPRLPTCYWSSTVENIDSRGKENAEPGG